MTRQAYPASDHREQPQQERLHLQSLCYIFIPKRLILYLTELSYDRVLETQIVEVVELAHFFPRHHVHGDGPHHRRAIALSIRVSEPSHPAV